MALWTVFIVLKCPILLKKKLSSVESVFLFSKHFCSDICVTNSWSLLIASFQLGRAKDECDGTEDTVQQ